MTILRAVALLVAMLAMVGTAEARHHHRQHHYSHHARNYVAQDANGNAVRHYRRHARGGSCDGFTRCRCGTTAARHFGIPYAYKGFNLKMASEWVRAFPHTSFRVGVAGVKPHHVLAVVGGSSCASATVHDDAGTYQRNVCRMTFVSVSG